MSSVFEAILFKASFEQIKDNINQKISTNIKLYLGKINDDLSCFHVVENSRNFFYDLEYVASQISIIFSQALLIRYDGRVAYRESTVFQEGYPIKKFDLADEIWVMLDKGGKPIVNGTQFTVEQISDNDNEEYETVYNAIQLGIKSIGINKNV
ncbi:hypothetical protein NIES267_08860 [Calothrix parasitica NIES-267]|uniref:Uncharacterized protein n=1 Tax=Calothrix parasitica NIES-267 TaxID=1973488 RepID=A0A1Z4LJI6_9CYAN|nr:hypothetical protein NIES267_08860 [Calothrix parasitica NIES-267]